MELEQSFSKKSVTVLKASLKYVGDIDKEVQILNFYGIKIGSKLGQPLEFRDLFGEVRDRKGCVHRREIARREIRGKTKLEFLVLRRNIICRGMLTERGRESVSIHFLDEF